jgi:putative endonuclease
MSRLKYLYVYILKCSDETYYTGVSSNPELRLRQHNFGFDKEAYTYSRRPVELVYCEKFSDYLLAIAWEKRIKRWSRKKKEALINSDWQKLIEAAECKNETSHRNTSRLKH